MFFWNDNNAVPQDEEDPLVGIQAMMRWQNAWMRAIALVWADETGKLQQELIADAPKFFKKRCNWVVPLPLDLRVSAEPPVDPEGHKAGWYPGGIADPSSEDEGHRGWHLPQTLVVMQIPPKPENLAQSPVALANYLATGRSYPFTTC